MSPYCKYRMEINRQIGLVLVVWIWNKNLKNVNPNRANFLLCTADKLQKTSLSLFFWYTVRPVPPVSQKWHMEISLLIKAIIILMNPNKNKPIQISVFMAVNAETDSGRIFFVIGAQIATFCGMLYSGHSI